MELNGKVAVVTGAAGGIGHALAKRFAAEGAIVVSTDVRQDSELLVNDPLSGRFVMSDLSYERGVVDLVEDIMANEGRIDLFASNAGVAYPMDVTSSEEDWRKIVAINQMSHIWVARHVVPDMLERGGGYLLVTASAAGLLNEIDSFGYGVTKHAAVGFAEWLAFTYRDQGLKVSALCPEGVKTRMIADSPYLQKNAVTPGFVAETVVEALREERFMILTHAHTIDKFREKAADYEAYIDSMVELRRRATASRRESEKGPLNMDSSPSVSL